MDLRAREKLSERPNKLAEVATDRRLSAILEAFREVGVLKRFMNTHKSRNGSFTELKR